MLFSYLSIANAAIDWRQKAKDLHQLGTNVPQSDRQIYHQ